MKKLIKKVIPKKFHRILINIRKPFIKDYKKSYSQSGEDMILNTILAYVERGFYVDIGANNPTSQSNTHYFYKKGWQGINIDALPGSMKKFRKMRPRDINLEIPISDREEKLNYFMFSESFYNSFLEESSILYKDILIEKKQLATKKLSWVLDNYLTNREIDFMTIDVEGMDFQVLKSNDWTKYRPKVLVIELFANEIASVESKEISNYLNTKGYSLYCFSPTNIFFIENEFYNLRFKNN